MRISDWSSDVCSSDLIDPASRSEAFISDAGRRFLADPAAVAALAATLTVDSIDPDSLVGMLLVGGAGGVWDLPLTPKIAKIAERLAARGALVTASTPSVTGTTFSLDPIAPPRIKKRPIYYTNTI